jgi:hypothetical protein
MDCGRHAMAYGVRLGSGAWRAFAEMQTSKNRSLIRSVGGTGMPTRLVLILALSIGAIGAASAQQIDERAAQAACQDDALRYCQATIPDRERTLACLVHNRDALTGACRSVLASVLPPEKKKRVKRPANVNAASR